LTKYSSSSVEISARSFFTAAPSARGRETMVSTLEGVVRRYLCTASLQHWGLHRQCWRRHPNGVDDAVCVVARGQGMLFRCEQSTASRAGGRLEGAREGEGENIGGVGGERCIAVALLSV
jgi:hypothetical protein